MRLLCLPSRAGEKIVHRYLARAGELGGSEGSGIGFEVGPEAVGKCVLIPADRQTSCLQLLTEAVHHHVDEVVGRQPLS